MVGETELGSAAVQPGKG